MEEFNEALEERRILDDREKRRQMRRGNTNDGLSSPSTTGMRTPDANSNRRYMFTTEEGMSSRPGSRAGFRRPGEAPEGVSTPSGGRLDELKRLEGGTPRVGAAPLPASTPKMSTPIPSVFTPTALTRAGSGYPFSTPTGGAPAEGGTSKPPMSIEELNRLQAKVLRAKLMEDPDAEALEEQYDYERARAEEGGGDLGGVGMWEGSGAGKQGQMGREVNGKRVEVQVLPTLDGRGQLYDVGTGKQDEAVARPGNKRKKPEKAGCQQCLG